MELPVFFGFLLIGNLAGVATAHEAGPAPFQVQFENSCTEEVQSDFTQGLTLLHSFEYPEITKIFRNIIEKDPGCAIGYWGAAMSIWHPLWALPNSNQLAQGAALLNQTKGLEASPRERAFIEALKAFFSSTDTKTHRARAKAYEAAMKTVFEASPDDPEAALFYALSLLATANPKDKNYINQLKAASILKGVQETLPTHPGVLHYLIHSYDFPDLADLGLEAAKAYAGAAPNSSHAQHMPSHIFTRLGLWELSLVSNHQATASAVEYTRTANLPGFYDDGVHSMDYLMYAMLQTARDDEAEALLDRLGNLGKTNTENFKVAFVYAASPARFALERRQWKDASELTLGPPHFQWQEFGSAVAIHHFARGIGAARIGQIEKARVEWGILKDIQEALPDTTLAYWQEEVRVELDAVMAWIVLAEGNVDEALRLASAAADREDAVDKHPVTPGEILPARELYADMLFETENFVEALQHYRIVLTSAPNRLNALLGAARAALALDESELAEEYYAIVRAQTGSGNKQRPGLAQAWE